jgi:phosphoribosyl 1,2-cyclic phosphodiesterase
LKVDALASGSSGNAYLVRSGETSLLVEAGLPASRLTKFLLGAGVDPRTLSGILLTHAHTDHLKGARELSDRFDVPIFSTCGTLGHRSLRDSPLARPVAAGRPFELGEVEILTFRVPHDCVEPVGYRISGPSSTICLTTDLGFVPDEVLPRLEACDLLVLEANHDEEMLQRGPYPQFLKRRVLGQSGHLSNLAAAECLARLARRPPGAVWLAHLSLVNNRVSSALEVVRGALERRGLADVAVDAVGRNRPSLRWRSDCPKQLALF